MREKGDIIFVKINYEIIERRMIEIIEIIDGLQRTNSK